MSNSTTDIFQAEDNKRLQITLRRLENLNKDKAKTPEGQMIKSPLVSIKPFRYNHAKLSARKKYEREVKIHRETSDILSPISEFTTPKIIHSGSSQGRKVFCIESQKNKRNKRNQLSSPKSKSNNSSNPSNDRMPNKKRIHSEKSNSSKKRTVSAKLSFPSEPNAGKNIVKKVEKATKRQSERIRRKKKQAGSTKAFQSNKRISNSYFSDKEKEDKAGGSIRRSERIKMKFIKTNMSIQ
ncbi:uncharacterized protein LOC106663262 isoform X2 [Cimex lectularius]|uniref:Uncharacterized protein n=1 Tax=Cimex lectularius TaxID=79782 RepID=A0A8I6RET3_CIMLE|nr:uncharacterized protein LOC106663262 isoform X2 [Cimex lectularius]